MPTKETTIWGIAKLYKTGDPDSLVGVFPKPLRDNLGISQGERFLIKTESENPDRIIFERLEKGR